MSNKALDLLIEAELLTTRGRMVSVAFLPSQELSRRVDHYINARKQSVISEMNSFQKNNKLSAFFSTTYAKNANNDNLLFEKLLASSLIYESIIIDDPLFLFSSSISLDGDSQTSLVKALSLFEWTFKLIRSGFIKILPISFLNKPSDEIPLLYSEDAFRSLIPSHIHDFSHKNAILKSVIQNSNGFLILPEEACIKKRKGLSVQFKDDYGINGGSIFFHFDLVIENFEEQPDGSLKFCKRVKPNDTLSEEQFNYWVYQSINEAIISRLSNIYKENSLAITLDHTYVTESKFESKLLALSGIECDSDNHNAINFLEANSEFLHIESPEIILELRTKYSQAFERFNYSILNATEELSELDNTNFDKRAKWLFNNEILPQIDEIRDAINSIPSGFTKGTLASLAGFSIAVLTGFVPPLIPTLMLSAAGGLTEAFPSISTYQNMKKKPGYIWHRITK